MSSSFITEDLLLDLLEDGAAYILLLYYYAAFFGWQKIPRLRTPSIFSQRLYWQEYCAAHVERNTFGRRLRMSKPSFDKLLALVRGRLEVNELRARSRGGAIIPELCLYCTIRYLAGGSYLDICDIAGISQASFYRVVWKTMKVINSTGALRIKFPEGSSELNKAISDFSTISTDMAIVNCIGVIDGYLLRIKVPSKKEAGNVRSYFSGHYQCYGVNIQAVADYQSRFIYIGLAAPGVTADRDALEQCDRLYDAIEGLPFGMCIIGDAAYEATEKMVPVYQGYEKTIAKYDNFNFFASQLRIRIEMAFGMMQMKWGILQRPLGCSLKHVGVLIQCVGRLHNYVITERLQAEGKERPADRVPADPVSIDTAGSMYLPSMPHDADGDPINLEAMFNVGKRSGHSDMREWMVKRIANRPHLVHPEKNKIGDVRDRDPMFDMPDEPQEPQEQPPVDDGQEHEDDTAEI